MLEQSTTVSLAAWQAALPSHWLPPAFRDTGTRKISVRRRDVFALAEEAHTPVGAVHTYVAAAAWGSAPGREVSRRLRAFTDIEAVARKLAAVTGILAANGTSRAFAALLHGDQRLPHLGPAFGTKFLYFAGYGRVPAGPQPLILDKNTGIAVQRLSGHRCPHVQVNPDDYLNYLQVLHGWAKSWNDCEPDVVERAAFDVGKASELAVSVLAGVPYS